MRDDLLKHIRDAESVRIEIANNVTIRKIIEEASLLAAEVAAALLETDPYADAEQWRALKREYDAYRFIPLAIDQLYERAQQAVDAIEAGAVEE